MSARKRLPDMAKRPMPKANSTVMKALYLAVACGTLFLSGCAHSYVVTLTNGSRMTAASKPKLKNGVYYFKDAKGRETSVSQGRIREIAPSSMANDEKGQFKAISK